MSGQAIRDQMDAIVRYAQRDRDRHDNTQQPAYGRTCQGSHPNPTLHDKTLDRLLTSLVELTIRTVEQDGPDEARAALDTEALIDHQNWVAGRILAANM